MRWVEGQREFKINKKDWRQEEGMKKKVD